MLVLAGSEDTWHRRLQVGLLASGRSGLGQPRGGGPAARARWGDRRTAVELSAPRRPSATSACRATLAHGRTPIGPVDVLMWRGFRCASATRTIIDLAHARIPTERLEAAIDSAVRLGLTAPAVLEQRLAEVRGRGRWGASPSTAC